MYLDGGDIIKHSGDMFTHFNPNCLVEKTATSCHSTTLEDCKLEEEEYKESCVKNDGFEVLRIMYCRIQFFSSPQDSSFVEIKVKDVV